MKFNLFFFFISIGLFSQTTPKEVVEQFFFAMEKNDSVGLDELVLVKDNFYSVYNQKGTLSIKQTTFSDFVKGVKIANEKFPNWKEEILDYTIQQDTLLASVWTPYVFYFNKEKNQKNHCGVNLFNLVKKERNWKIVSILDSRVPCQD